jgi:methionyl-tRNA formyltransferase
VKVVTIGQSWLAQNVLISLLSLPDIKVAAALPERPGDRFELEAKKQNLPVVAPNGIPYCDLIIAAHCHTYLTMAIRAKASIGALVYHPSLLPRHRGKDAVKATIKCGDPIAGGSLFWADDGYDTGNIEARDWCFVHPDWKAKDLWIKALCPLGIKLIKSTVKRLATGHPPSQTPQDEQFATYT